MISVSEFFDDLRAWPAKAAAPVAHLESTLPEITELGIEGLVEKAAAALRSWGDTDAPKIAASKQSLWKDPNAHPVVLTLMLLDRYGQECLEWDPAVLRVTLRRDDVQLSNSSWTKILAMRVALMSPSPWRQWEVFHAVCLGLAGTQPNFIYLEQPEIKYLMAGIDILHLVDPSRATSGEVDKYIAAALKNEGNVFAPAPLSVARRALENPQLNCKDCGALHNDDGDVRCISCGSQALKLVPFEFEELRKECEKLWSTRSQSPLEKAVDGLPQDAAGNLVYHLLVDWDYAKQMRQLLLQQLRVLA